MQKVTFFVTLRHNRQYKLYDEKMSYFDDFKLLNITQVRMYGMSKLELIRTHCHYIGIMQGKVLLNNSVAAEPFIYFTPGNIDTLNGWQSPPGCWRDNFYIECCGSRADRLMTAFNAADCVRHYPVANPEQYTAIFNEMRRCFSSVRSFSAAGTALLIEEFAALLENELSHRQQSSIQRYGIAEFVDAVVRDPGACHDAAAAAENNNITLRHWCRLFTEYTGYTPYALVMMYRMKSARKLLSSSNMPVKEIAGRCGFANASDFSRFFKRQCGMTPGEFRNARLH